MIDLSMGVDVPRGTIKWGVDRQLQTTEVPTDNRVQ
jgi:hypothetical protein